MINRNFYARIGLVKIKRYVIFYFIRREQIINEKCCYHYDKEGIRQPFSSIMHNYFSAVSTCRTASIKPSCLPVFEIDSLFIFTIFFDVSTMCM